MNTARHTINRPVLDGGSDGIELTLGLPIPEYADVAEVQDDGTAIYMDPEGVVDMGVQTVDDGSARMLTVINDEIAPGKYDYQIDVEDGVVLELTPEGAVALKGADGSSQGMRAAWTAGLSGRCCSTATAHCGQQNWVTVFPETS